jgi:hypothetical protein
MADEFRRKPGKVDRLVQLTDKLVDDGLAYKVEHQDLFRGPPMFQYSDVPAGSEPPYQARKIERRPPPSTASNKR